jgi:hypothetical protein
MMISRICNQFVRRLTAYIALDECRKGQETLQLKCILQTSAYGTTVCIAVELEKLFQMEQI